MSKAILNFLQKQFEEEVKDTELQIRYNEMKKVVDTCNKSLSSLRPEIEKSKSNLGMYDSLILNLALQGNNSCFELSKEREKEQSNYISLKQRYKLIYGDCENEIELIKQYEKATRNKLFIFWRLMKNAGMQQPWQEFEAEYKDRIF